MSKENKKINGPFINVVGNESDVSTYDRFINMRTKKDSAELKNLIDGYSGILEEKEDLFEKLASLEEVIIQMRIRQSMGEIKLSTVREYIYARTSFFRRNKKTKDVRVIVGKTTDYPGETIETLVENKLFMKSSKNRLMEIMDDEIQSNLISVGDGI